MVLPKGGRGHKAPYETCTIRIPVPLKEKFEIIAEQYRMAIINNDIKTAERYLQLDIDNDCDRHLSLDLALSAVKNLLTDKKMAKKRLAIKLLQLIYDSDLSVTDLEKMLDNKDVTT